MSTGRLKRKLGDLGVDTSSGRATENFCLIGTPLPPLEKSRDNGEFVPLWKQDVRDEQGRRRLHGAFTGGFSAGYFNSVGSKEGWTPQTFVSSRNERAKKQAARPEDFMDEEDLQELKDSRNLVDTTDEMSFAAKPVDDTENDSIASKLEASMLPAPKDSSGAKILKKMGWRMGQGIGPRVSLKQRKLQDLQAFTGRAQTSDDLKVVEDDEEAGKHTYAPRDTPVLKFARKDNFHGLGYRPGMGLNESLGVKVSGTASGKPSGPTIAAGFGLGALNDADEDDLDIYDGGAQSRNRVAYDFGDGPTDDTIVIGNAKGKGKQAEVRAPARAFNDGKPLLAGFVAADKPSIEDRWFPLPDIPRGWKPDPKRVWSQQADKENVQKHSRPSTMSHAEWKASQPTADERGALLGETPLAAAPRSVFEYMSKKDRERIQSIAEGGVPIPPGAHSTASSAPQNLNVPHLEAHIASAALRGFRPFATDSGKQARYTAYVQSQADPSAYPFSLKPLPGQRMEDFNKELEDYSKSAQLFKPVTGAMAGRFTTATVVDHGPRIIEGLHQPTEEEMTAKEEEARKQIEENLTPKQHAAKMEMYGPMTRESKPWQPARLLCKRFGVKDPNPPPEEDTRPPPSDVPEAPAPDASFFPLPSAATTSGGKKDPNNVGLGEDDSQGRDTLTYERPSMDVFKAIFASDDEDSEDEKEDKEDEMDVDPPEPTHGEVTEPVVTFPDGPVDANTFKPTFIPREGKVKERGNKDNDKKKKKKDKGKKQVLVSFAIEEEGGGGDGATVVKKKRKKEKDGKGRKGEDDDDSMWVEKPRPTAAPDAGSTTLSSAEGESRGRKRAIDFM